MMESEVAQEHFGLASTTNRCEPVALEQTEVTQQAYLDLHELPSGNRMLIRCEQLHLVASR